MTAAACATRDRPLDPQSGRRAVAVQEVVYAAPDGEALEADLYRPAGDGPFPALVLVHGGAWHGGRRAEMHRSGMRLARHGYLALSVDYRTAPGARRPEVDAQRLGTWGYSAGAHLAALLALREPALTACQRPDLPLVKAAVVGGTPSDLFRFDNLVVRDFVGGSPQELPDRYALASPARRVLPGAPPFFLYHGRLDVLVPAEQSERLAAALARARVPYEYLERPGGHSHTLRSDDETHRRALAFLARWL
ncbi:MAG: prolyl oligopeptidase family serine peptidase [Deltaproteobacteria bacterium]|nr:prolyl oligopeptidase family serine peptidase [Deltaproteobacteria bacterium]